jgi:hypothetical protein
MSLKDEVEEFIRISEANFGSGKGKGHSKKIQELQQPHTQVQNNLHMKMPPAPTVTVETQVSRMVSILTNVTIVQQSLIELLIKKNCISGTELSILIKHNCTLLNELNNLFKKGGGNDGQ